MERLTYVKCPHRWDSGKHPTKYTSKHTFQEVVARLAAYEDTGFTPEAIITMRGELCLKCGRYQEAHLGACNGCRWRKED